MFIDASALTALLTDEDDARELLGAHAGPRTRITLRSGKRQSRSLESWTLRSQMRPRPSKTISS